MKTKGSHPKNLFIKFQNFIIKTFSLLEAFEVLLNNELHFNLGHNCNNWKKLESHIKKVFVINILLETFKSLYPKYKKNG